MAPTAPATRDEGAPAEAAHHTWGKDEKGSYALYRLRPGEALYSAVVVRFTGRLTASEVNRLAARVAERSGIRDVTDIPVGFPVKIPLELLLPQYWPPESETYRRWAEGRHEADEAGRTLASVSRSSLRVILDPGHGGADRGAMANGVWEDDYVYDVACRLREILLRRGVKVEMTLKDPSAGFRPQRASRFRKDDDEILLTHPFFRQRKGDSRTGVNLRWCLANAWARSGGISSTVFVSLHADSLHPSVRGAMFYVPGAEYRRTSWKVEGEKYRRYREARTGGKGSMSRKSLLQAEGASRSLARAMEARCRRKGIPLHRFGGVRDHVVRGGKGWVPAVLRYNLAPRAVLVEICNLNNRKDARNLRKYRFRQHMAEALAEALLGKRR